MFSLFFRQTKIRTFDMATGWGQASVGDCDDKSFNMFYMLHDYFDDDDGFTSTNTCGLLVFSFMGDVLVHLY